MQKLRTDNLLSKEDSKLKKTGKNNPETTMAAG